MVVIETIAYHNLWNCKACVYMNVIGLPLPAGILAGAGAGGGGAWPSLKQPHIEDRHNHT